MRDTVSSFAFSSWILPVHSSQIYLHFLLSVRIEIVTDPVAIQPVTGMSFNQEAFLETVLQVMGGSSDVKGRTFAHRYALSDHTTKNIREMIEYLETAVAS